MLLSSERQMSKRTCTGVHRRSIHVRAFGLAGDDRLVWNGFIRVAIQENAYSRRVVFSKVLVETRPAVVGFAVYGKLQSQIVCFLIAPRTKDNTARVGVTA